VRLLVSPAAFFRTTFAFTANFLLRLSCLRAGFFSLTLTSFSFIFGVLPLAISTGAGANSRIAIGTSVIGGMITATVLAIFYIPLFFVLVRRGVRDGVVYIRERRQRRREAAV
jgi:multidrug efflux pump